MVRRGASNGALRELRIGKLDAAADRGAVGERARHFQQLVAELARGRGAVDHRPVDHELLRAEARPFDEADRDLLVRSGPDRIEHLRVGDRRGVAFALQLELRMVDAARHVGGQHQQQVDLLGGRVAVVEIRTSAASASAMRMRRVMGITSQVVEGGVTATTHRPTSSLADSVGLAMGLTLPATAILRMPRLRQQP